MAKKLPQHGYNKVNKEVVSMRTSLKNDLIEIIVDSYGAELTSLKTVKDSLEYLWQKDENYWNRQNPTFFPIIGAMPNDRYQYEGQLYEMKKHGFVRWYEFELVSDEADELVYRWGYSEESLQQYPFKFEFFIKYKLESNTLRQSFQINNLDTKAMPFALGAHPGFNCPLNKGEQMKDYYLLFEKSEKLNRLVLNQEEEMLTGETKEFLNDEREKALYHSMFPNGEPKILKNTASKWVELRSRVNERAIRIGFEKFPNLVIWSAKNDAPFVCLEPWHGIPQTKGDPIDLETKKGMQMLAPGGSYECGFTITVE
jgi:galactose mutarotase-like enzyme